MDAARPETTTDTADLLRKLLAVTDGRDLEALLQSIDFTTIAPTDDEWDRLRNAVASATARCWTRRWPKDCCD